MLESRVNNVIFIHKYRNSGRNYEEAIYLIIPQLADGRYGWGLATNNYDTAVNWTASSVLITFI